MINYVLEENAYAFVGGALRKVELISQLLTYRFDELSHCEMPNEIEIIAKCDNEQYTLSPKDLFSSKEAYLKSENIVPFAIAYHDLKLTKEWTYFILENGRPIEKSFVWKHIHAENKSGLWVFSCPELPNEYFRNIETCAGMSEFKYIDEEGKEQTHKGFIHNILLSAEQNKIVNEICDLMAKANKAGISFAYDTDSCKMLAFNGNDKKNCIGYYDDIDEDQYDLVPGDALNLVMMNVDVAYMGSDDTIGVKKEQ